MTPPAAPAGDSTPRIVLGILLLAQGRAQGFRHFGDTAQAFLTSLAPLVAFPLVGSLVELLAGSWREAVTDLFAAICALLLPPVVSHALARHWSREEAWTRYATAFNWCQWAIPCVATLMLLAMAGVVMLGVSGAVAGAFAIGTLVAYLLWLHWFLAREGLSLSRGRAAALVAAVNLGTLALMLGPRLLAVALGTAGEN